jgi:hypothetical protein
MPPNLHQQLVLREEATGFGGQHGQQVELPNSQTLLSTLDLDAATGEVDRQRADLDIRLGLCRRRRRQDPPVEMPDTQQAPLRLVGEPDLDLPVAALAELCFQLAAAGPPASFISVSERGRRAPLSIIPISVRCSEQRFPSSSCE